LRKKLKHHIPKPLPKNIIWSIDLTTIENKQVFGIIDNGTRALLYLKQLPNKSTINILKALLYAMEAYNKPKIIKSDNEKVFTSKLMVFALWLLNIKQQRTHIASPWENGKIERFFGTLKYHLYRSKKKMKLKLLQTTLDEFRFYYNHIRPHQHLHFLTPSEAWDDKEILTSKDTSEIYSFRGKYLTLSGFYMRR
jgi:transposase InsO family protein